MGKLKDNNSPVTKNGSVTIGLSLKFPIKC